MEPQISPKRLIKTVIALSILSAKICRCSHAETIPVVNCPIISEKQVAIASQLADRVYQAYVPSACNQSLNLSMETLYNICDKTEPNNLDFLFESENCCKMINRHSAYLIFLRKVEKTPQVTGYALSALMETNENFDIVEKKLSPHFKGIF